MIKALFLATLVAVAVAAPADNKDETLDTAAQGIIGYSPALYGGIIPGGVSTVVTQRIYRTHHGGLANLGYPVGGYGLGYGIPYGGIGYGRYAGIY